jgi:hypothetical protein
MKTARGEYRRHDRTGITLPVDVNIAGKQLVTSTLNISLGGIALLRSQEQVLEKDQLVSVSFRGVPGVSVTARVVYLGSEHIGLSLYKNRFTDTDIDLLIAMAPQWQRLKILAWRTIWKHARRSAVFLANTLLRRLLIGFYKPRFLFAAYGTRKDVETYFTPWMERLLPSVILCGLIRNGKHHGFLVASKYLESELAESSDKVRIYLDKIKDELPVVDRVALVGRLPNFVMKAGIPIVSPFVAGATGTRYMIWDVARQMREIAAYKDQDSIVVLGGAGRIGNQVCEDLLSLYGTVIAFDKRYHEEEVIPQRHGHIVRSASPARMNQSLLFIGLTHHGDVIQEWAAHIPAGSLIADDTHPCISLDVRESLASQKIKTLKIVLTHADFEMKPRMPAWSARDIPGCLVEALVLLDHDDDVVADFGRFCALAANAGFAGRLVEPLDE